MRWQALRLCHDNHTPMKHRMKLTAIIGLAAGSLTAQTTASGSWNIPRRGGTAFFRTAATFQPILDLTERLGGDGAASGMEACSAGTFGRKAMGMDDQQLTVRGDQRNAGPQRLLAASRGETCANLPRLHDVVNHQLGHLFEPMRRALGYDDDVTLGKRSAVAAADARSADLTGSRCLSALDSATGHECR